MALGPMARVRQRALPPARLVLLVFSAMLTLGLPHRFAGDIGLGRVRRRVAPPEDAGKALHQPASAPDARVRHPTRFTSLVAGPQLLSTKGVDFVRIG